MIELQVLGIGSPFGDDRLGWEVIKLLQQQLPDDICNRLQLALCDRPGCNLLNVVRKAKKVFLVDAVKTGAKVGTLHYLKNEEITAMDSLHSTHGLGIAHALKIGEVLDLLPKNITLYGIEIAEIRSQFALSKPIKHAIPKLARQIKQDIFLTLK